MTFPYIRVLRFHKHKKRERMLPWIRFGIFNPEDRSTIIYPLGLIDSGSDITFIDHEFGERLGFDIKKGHKGKAHGIGGGKIDIYFFKVGLSISDGSKEKSIVYEDFVGFTFKEFPISMPQQTAILGTMGFFRNVDITFSYPNYMSIKQKALK